MREKRSARRAAHREPSQLGGEGHEAQPKAEVLRQRELHPHVSDLWVGGGGGGLRWS